MERELCELLDHEVGAVEAERRRHSIGTATLKIPAAFAAFTPFGESSKAIAIVTADMRRTVSSCKRSASTGLPQRCHRVPPKCTAAAETGSESALGGKRRNTYTGSKRLITRRSQVQILPPLLQKALETGLFAY